MTYIPGNDEKNFPASILDTPAITAGETKVLLKIELDFFSSILKGSAFFGHPKNIQFKKVGKSCCWQEQQ